jgi:hypothetical protein
MRRNVDLCIVALALIAFATPLRASEPSEKDEGNAGIGLWLAASDIDVLGAYIANWLPSFDLENAGMWRDLFSSKDDRQRDPRPALALSAQSMSSYLDLATSWSIAKGITMRADVTGQDGPLVPGAPPASGNGFAQVYEMLGRHVFVTLSAKF